MKIKIEDRSCENLSDLAWIVGNNATVEVRRLKKLSRRLGCAVTIGVIFSVAIEYRFAKQYKRIAALCEKVTELDAEIKGA